MRTIKTINELSSSSIKQYRSLLRRLYLKLPTVTDAMERARSVRDITRYERQLGVSADSIPAPGRPKRKV